MRAGFRTEQSQDNNQDSCFECLKGGKLFCCESCPRAFHDDCSVLNKNEESNEWQCFYCFSERHCEFCQKEVQGDMIKLCTICLRPSHIACIGQYQQVSLTEEETPLKQCTYSCISCLFKYGIRKILKSMRLYKANNLSYDEGIVFLVQLNYKSPVHCSLYKEKEVKQAFILTQKANKQREKLMNQEAFYKNFSLESIIGMRVPKSEKGKQDNFIASLLLDKERKVTFGRNSFLFLVKWKNISYEHCTWQDQYIVNQLDPQKRKIQQFVKQPEAKDIQPCLDLPSILQQKKIAWNQLVSYQSILKMTKFNITYPLQIIDLSHQPLDKSIANVCYFLNYIYLIEERKSPSILLIKPGSFDFWVTEMRESCSLLDVLIFQGSERNLQIIKARELASKHIRFQVLMTTADIFSKNKFFLQSCISSTAFLIFEYSHFYASVVQSIFKGLSSHLIFLVSHERSIQDFTLNLSQAYSKDYILSHDIDWKSFTVIPPLGVPKSKQFTYDHHHYFAPYQVRQEKRITILRFIVRYGLPQQDYTKFYLQLNKFTPQMFDLSHIDEHVPILMGYMKSLVSLLILHKQIQLPAGVKQYYLFDIEPDNLVQVTTNMARLRGIASKGERLELEMSEMYDEKDQCLGLFQWWKSDEDWILLQLVVQLGYEWSKIFQTYQWKKYSLNKQNLKSILTFHTHIKMKCLFQFRTTAVNLQRFMNRRLQIMLQ